MNTPPLTDTVHLPHSTLYKTTISVTVHLPLCEQTHTTNTTQDPHRHDNDTRLTTKQTTLGQTTHETEAHDNDKGSPDEDDENDTPLVLSQPIES